MKHMKKPSTVWIIFLILFISMSLMLIAGESVIHIARQELETRALETTKAEIGHISDALYAQLTSIQMENTEILNNESVLALAMRSSILDKFEMVSYKSAIMKLMRTELSRTNIATKAQLYIPTVRTIITPQKAVEVSDEELQELLSIVTAFPNGLYYTDGEIGFWRASPLIYNAAAARDSRIMMTGIPRSFLREMLGSYTQPIGCQLLLTFGNHILANSHDIEWDESVYGEFPKDVKTVESGGSSYYVIRAKHAFSDLSIVAVLPVNNVMRNMHRLQLMMKILELISLLILALAAVAYYRIVCAPLKRVSAKMQQIGDGDLSVRMGPEKTAEWEDVRCTFNSMAERLHQLIDREYKSRLLAASAEKKALQYQISPHFLYNTYFQLRNLILLEENDQASRMADLMGSYLRYIVHQDDPCATLAEELEHARNYAEIQRMRFENRIEVIYEMTEGDWQKLVVPRLLVQPLIENAFGHGLKNMEKGVVRLRVQTTGPKTVISVEDNGDGLDEEMISRLRRIIQEGENKEGEGIALVNIHRRLQLHFGPASRLECSRSELGGLHAAIVITAGEEREHVPDFAGG